MLKADVWRDTLLKEEASLNAKLQELEAENDEKRFDDAREEAQTRLAEVHARLADMEAESGPARAAALLAGTWVHQMSPLHTDCAVRSWIQRGGPEAPDEVIQWRLAHASCNC